MSRSARAQTPIDLVHAINSLGGDLFLRQLTDPGSNLVLSPVSIGLCLAMAASGSAGDTAAEIEKALGLEPKSSPRLPDASKLLSEQLKAITGLSVANALAFPGPTTRFRQDYIARVRGGFDAEVLTQATVDGVNAWMHEKTRGKAFKAVESLGAVTLVSALFFKGEWPVSVGSSDIGRFTTANGEVINLPKMTKSAKRGGETAGLRIFWLSYKESTVSMMIVLMRQDQTTADGARIMNPTRLKMLLDRHHDDKTGAFDNLIMPPFQVHFKADMKRLLKEAGLATMFDPEDADFSGMADRSVDKNLYVDDIRHQSMIEVDRLGTTNTTTAPFRFPSARFGDERNIKVDRPFLFYLIDRATGAVLMQGCVNDPRLT